MAINAYRFETPATTGGAGASTATSPEKHLRGKIVAIDLAYIGSPPAGTTDVTVRTKGYSGQTATTILKITNGATDGLRYPTVALVDSTGSAVSDPAVAHGFPVDDAVDVLIEGANDGDSVVATVLVEEGTP